MLRASECAVLTLKEALQGAPHTGAVDKRLPPTSVSEGVGAANKNTESL